MKKLILSVMMLAAAFVCRAQGTLSASGERSEWLPSFTSIVAEGPFDIVLVGVPDSVAPKVVYDTKGSYTTRFRAEVKDRVLHIREKADARRPDRTQVRVCYNTMRTLDVTDSDVSFADTVSQPMLDVTVAGYGNLSGKLDVKDLDMNVSGHSTVMLSGRVRYLTLFVSSGKVDAVALETMSARVNVQSNASVTLNVTDRLEGRTSTGGIIRYKGEPAILRNAMKFMAGDIKPLE